MPQVADSGFLVAYWSERDAHHDWARGLSKEPPLLTYAPVLTEAAYMIGDPEPLLQMIVDGDLKADFDVGLHAQSLLVWLEEYADLNPGLADACVVALADLTPGATILTTDRRHFSGYRTLAGKPLNCIFPPVK
jgi:predicted nucleic acid-binding protein